MNTLKVLSQADVSRVATRELIFEAVRLALIGAQDGSAVTNPVVIASGLNPGERFSIKSGSAARDQIVGLKIGSYWLGNIEHSLPAHASSILLLDPGTGRLMAVLEASELNGPRTAAADALAAAVLAREDAKTLSIIGAGHQARFEAHAICAVRPVRRILIASRTAANSEALRAQLTSDLGLEIRTVDVETACRSADILVTATTSTKALFEAQWVREGTHVASMGSDQRGKQELPTQLLERSRLFCDLPSQSISIGEFQHVRAQVERGDLALTAIGAVLAGLVPGRQSEREITVFDSSGLALQDLFVAAAVLRAHELEAKKRGTAGAVR